MTKTDEIREATHRIERALREHNGGFKNPAAKAAIGREIDYIDARLSIQREKLVSLRGFIGDLYSARKHATYAGGASQVRAFASGECMVIRMIADQLDDAGRREDDNEDQYPNHDGMIDSSSGKV